MKSILFRYWNDFLDLMFPRFCEACEKPLQGQEETICTSCRITLPRLSTDSMAYEAFTKRFASYPEVGGLHALLVFTKKGHVQQLIYGLKYRKKKDVGLLAGKMFAQENGVAEGDMIIPVPLHPRRKAERGYNQSEVFAEGISEIWNIPVENSVLIRNKYTVTQTGKTKEERESNVSGVFEVRDTEKIKGKCVILTDDVMTTGATLESCLRVLINAGCRQVHIITIAAAHH